MLDRREKVIELWPIQETDNLISCGIIFSHTKPDASDVQSGAVKFGFSGLTPGKVEIRRNPFESNMYFFRILKGE